MPTQPRNLLIQAVESGDLSAIDALIRDEPNILNPPNLRPPLLAARNIATAEHLLSRGADIESISRHWAGGMDTRKVATDVGKFLVERGASLTPHVAAGLGWLDRVADMLTADPSLIDAKGMDACTPLHFARDVETASLLLARGARINARDEDHESTPAQWLIGEAPEVVRFLLERGAASDIFLAAALGDRTLAEKLIHANPACLSHRIGRVGDFPPIGHQGRGGTIYQWTLAFNSYPHQIALLKGHKDLFDYLYAQSDTSTRLLVSCVLAHRPEAEAIAVANPGLVAALPPEDLELLARYCWETNTNYEAVKLMLDVGFPVAHPERSHGYSPLHNAAWSGSADLVDLLIARGHPVDLMDPRYNATPLGYAIHDCVVEKRHPEGEFGRVVKSLLDAGSPWNARDFPTGDPQIDDVFGPILVLMQQDSREQAWPELPLAAWSDTYATLHLWTQIVGKIRLVQSPWLNHSWHVPLYVTATGLTTSPIPYGLRSFEINFDFINHRLEIQASDGQTGGFSLQPESVAAFYRRLMAELGRLGLHVEIYKKPNEVPDPIRFDQDETHTAYASEYVNRFWRILVQTDRVLKEFRVRFIGKCSPVHLFWGALDLACTRFSGRTAPRHPGGVPNLPDAVTREAYSHEVSSCGFWPGGGPVAYPAFYSYAYPQPADFSKASIQPAAAFYSPDLGEFILPYDAVRQAESPDQMLLDFFQTTYEAAANLANWDRKSLERSQPIGTAIR